MWTHQYDQQVNQISCVKFPGRSIFRTNNEEAHLFGLEPNFGCCTANHNQGWPKLALSIYLKNSNGITAALILPSLLKTKINGVGVEVECDTQYPFRNSAVYKIKTEKECEVELKIRIPSWAKELTVNGEKQENNGYVIINKKWSGFENVAVSFEAEPKVVSRSFGMNVVEYGSLIFSLPIKAEYKMYEYEKDGVERKYPYCDYELYGQSEWRYGLSDTTFSVKEYEGDGIPFSSVSPKISLTAKLKPVLWDFAEGYETVSEKTPVSNKAIGEECEKELIPYGCAKLRITEMVIMIVVCRNAEKRFDKPLFKWLRQNYFKK